VTSQFPVENWHDLIGDPTLADAILDRLIHNAFKIHLTGESMRKNRKMLTQTGHSDT
jgi:DNA replication protein DnaC